MAFKGLLNNKAFKFDNRDYINYLSLKIRHQEVLILTLIKQMELNIFERRKHEIEISNNPIMGNFYVHNGKIIPNYIAERLYPNDDIVEIMYIDEFYRFYMRRKFKDLPNSPLIPAGVSQGNVVYLDKEILDNNNIRNEIIRLYRLDKNVCFFLRPDVSKI